jgi:hypothetical protein
MRGQRHRRPDQFSLHPLLGWDQQVGLLHHGYGATSRLPGRGISVVADDAAEPLDHLGLSAVHVIGQSARGAEGDGGRLGEGPFKAPSAP